MPPAGAATEACHDHRNPGTALRPEWFEGVQVNLSAVERRTAEFAGRLGSFGHDELAATDFIQVLDTSDVPAGVVNIVTGPRDELAKTLAEHDDVAALWHFGPRAGLAAAEAASAGNLKPVWSVGGRRLDWFSASQAQGAEYLRHACQVKNVWVPYGE